MLMLLLAISGCAVHQAKTKANTPADFDLPDGPPKVIQDMSQISNAIPKSEPLARYGNHSPYTVLGKTYHVMKTSAGYQEEGMGSWYGEKFAGRKTSSFEPYDPFAMTAAHKSLPLPTYVRVTNLENLKEIIVKVNDRGPFHGGRIIDLSYAAAAKLDYMEKGTARVRVEAINIPNATTSTPRDTTHGTSASKSTTQATRTATHIKPSFDSLIYLQVGAFSQLSTAQHLQTKLISALSSPVTITSAGDTDSQLHRVQVGPFQNEMNAILVSEQIKKQNMGDPLIIHR